MQARKSVCLYHPEEFITNFCYDQECLMPLCPSCIGEHTEYHEANGSKPAYHNINQILAEVQGLLFNSVCALEQDKKRNSELMGKIEAINELVREKVLAIKTMMCILVDEAFVQLERDMKLSLAKLHEQIGLYSMRKSERNAEVLSSTLQDLYSVSEGLKSDKFLGNIIIFLKEKNEAVTELHQRLSAELTANENYKPFIDVNNDAKNCIVSALSRLIRIEVPQASKLSENKDPRKRLNLPKSKNMFPDAQQAKLDKSYTPQRTSAFNKIGESSRQRSGLGLAVQQSNSPYRERASFGVATADSLRGRDYKQEYELLARKVSQMRKENEQMARQMK